MRTLITEIVTKYLKFNEKERFYMEENKKRYFFTIPIIIICLVIILITASYILLPWVTQRPNLNKMESELRSNRENLYIVIDYLIHADFDSITIWDTDVNNSEVGEMKMLTELGTGWVQINDEEVEEAITLLVKQGYQVISKDEHAVVFQRWSSLDAGRGIVYSIDGSDPARSELLPFLIELTPLTEDGWYFYVEDFAEWERQNEN